MVRHSSPPRQRSQVTRSSPDPEAGKAPAAATYSVDDVLNRCGACDAFHWLMLLYCGMSWMCDAMEVMILSYLGPSAKCEWNLTAVEESGLNSVVFAGMCVGAPVWGLVSDTYGRKTSFLLATLTSTVFGFASAAAPNFQALMAFRALVGFGIPAATVAFNMVLEWTPTRWRGLFAVGIEGFWTIGTWVQASLAYGLLNDLGWRKLVLVSTAPYVLLLLLLPLVPESPRFLLVKGRVDAAQQVLGRAMRVCRRDLPEGSLQPLLTQPEEDADDLAAPQAPRDKGCSSVAGKAARGTTAVWLKLKALFSAKLWSVTLVLMALWVVAAFVYYGLVQLPFQMTGEAEQKGCVQGRLTIPKDDLTSNLVTSVAEVPGLLISLVMIHWLSRKLAFAIPMGCIPVVLIPLMAGVKGQGSVACTFLARMFIYSAFNALWALCPEMYPTTVRSFGLGLNNAFSRIGGMLSSFAVQARHLSYSHTPEALFAGLAALTAALVFLLPHDKKGRALDDTLAEVKEVPPLQRGVSSLASRLGSKGSSSSTRGGWAGGKDGHTPLQHGGFSPTSSHRVDQEAAAAGDVASSSLLPRSGQL